MKIGIFTGGTSVRSKNIFTDISRYPTRKREINKGSTLTNKVELVSLACEDDNRHTTNRMKILQLWYNDRLGVMHEPFPKHAVDFTCLQLINPFLNKQWFLRVCS